MPAPRIAVPAALCALAAASLLAPFAPVYDPWAWLVWGRELVGFDLDTSAGPSWKPLPVLIAGVLAPAGDAAPVLWLLVARVGWLAAVALAYRLSWRLALPTRGAGRFAPRRLRLGRHLAGALAAIGVVLLFDPFTSWSRQFAGGLSEPLLVALVLGAVDRELSGRRGQALALGFAAALLRPEAWPLLAAYGIWAWRQEPRLRGWLLATAVALPVLWLVPDLLGSGDALTGATRAREGSGGFAHETVESLGRSLELPLAGLWAGAVVAVLAARRLREAPVLVLAAGAAAWIGIVAVLAGAGYAGLPRFAAPAAAIACVLGAVGVVGLVAAIDGMRVGAPGRRPALALGAVVLTALVLQGGVRAAEIPGELDRAADHGAVVDDLAEAVDRIGREQVVACPPSTTTDFLTETALAWDLELPLGKVARRFESAPQEGIAFVLGGGSVAVADALAGAEPLAREGNWAVYEISCVPAASAASGRPIAGVAGASRYGGSLASPSSR